MRKVSIVAILLFPLMLCTFASAEITITGDVEIDTDYDTVDGGEEDLTIYNMGGRIKFTPTARTETGDMFFEAKAEIMSNIQNKGITENDADDPVTLDDVWGRIGNNQFDVKIGRFEGYCLFDKGEDVKIVDAPGGPARYEGNYVRGRLDKPGQIAVHLWPNDFINIDIGTAYGTYQDDMTQNVLGIRPILALNFGPFEVAGGVDYLATSAQDDADDDITKFGFGGKIKAVFGPATFGINYCNGTEDGTNEDGTDIPETTTVSYGAYTTVSLGESDLGESKASIGAFYTTQEIDGIDNETEHLQYDVSLAHPLLVKDVIIKYAIGGATAEDDNDLDSEALGFRIRLCYSF